MLPTSGITGSLASTVGVKNAYRYRAYRYDTEIGLFYVGSRYYDPVTGRFLNADAVVAGVGATQGYNMFAYCNNDPVNMFDPSGHWGIPNWVKSSVSTVVNTVKKAVISVVNAVKTTANNIVAAVANKLPIKGEPNSKQTSPNGQQEREYGPDGKEKKDTNYGHLEHHPELPSPHGHDWEWDGDIPKRGPTYAPINWVNVAFGGGLTAVCVVGIVVVAADDATGIGVRDDFLFGPLGAGAGKGLIMIFGR